jgi:flagellar biosynthetic protein FliO
MLQQLPAPTAMPTTPDLPELEAIAESSTETSGDEGATAGNDFFLEEYNPDNSGLFTEVPADQTESTTPADEDIFSIEYGLDIIAKLALVLGLLYLALYGLRRLQKNKNVQPSRNDTTINLLETTGLAPGRSLHLVVVGEKTLLIGATDQQISVLAELQDATIPVLEETEEESFTDVLQAQSPPETAPPPVPVPPAVASPAVTSPLPQPTTTPVTQQPVPLPGDAGATYSPDWQSAMAHLRDGIRQVKQSVGES